MTNDKEFNDLETKKALNRLMDKNFLQIRSEKEIKSIMESEYIHRFDEIVDDDNWGCAEPYREVYKRLSEMYGIDVLRYLGQDEISDKSRIEYLELRANILEHSTIFIARAFYMSRKGHEFEYFYRLFANHRTLDDLCNDKQLKELFDKYYKNS